MTPVVPPVKNVVMGKATFVYPCVTVTVVGTWAKCVLLLLKDMIAFAGAGPVRVIIPRGEYPPAIDEGEIVNELMTAPELPSVVTVTVLLAVEEL